MLIFSGALASATGTSHTSPSAAMPRRFDHALRFEDEIKTLLLLKTFLGVGRATGGDAVVDRGSLADVRGADDADLGTLGPRGRRDHHGRGRRRRGAVDHH